MARKTSEKKAPKITTSISGIPEIHVPDSAPEKRELSNAKRMMQTLDKFLARHISYVILPYIAVMIACFTILGLNGINTFASSGHTSYEANQTNSIIFALAGVATFFIFLCLVRYYSIRKHYPKK